MEQSRYERFVAASRRGTNEAAWTSTWKAGRVLSLDAAAERALSPEDPRTDAAHKPASDPLTPREREVALLVPAPLSTRRVAEKLSISQNTPAPHVGRILKKLGLRSRSQIGARLLRERHDLPD